jgi:SprT protein
MIDELEILKRKVNEKINQCLDIYQDTYGERPDFPEVDYNLKGTRAGTALRHTNKITLNKELLIKYKDSFINRTVVHEMAHRLTWYYKKDKTERYKPHGYEWKVMMNLLGVNKPERCHSYDVSPSRLQRRFAYTCNCENRIHAISLTKHNRINKVYRSQSYICKSCNMVIVFSGKEIK